MHVEDERLAAPRGHHGQHAAATPQGVQRLALGRQQGFVADEGAHDVVCELVLRQLGERVGTRGARSERGLGQAARKNLGHAGKKLARDGGGLDARRGLAVDDVTHHELGLRAALPGLGDGLEDEVDGALVVAGALDVGGAEHDRGHAAHAVGGEEAQVLARTAHAAAGTHDHAARGQQRHLVALAKGFERPQRLDRGHVELVEAHDGRDLAGVDELLGGELGQHALEAGAEGVDVGGIDRDAHGARVPAKAHEQIGALLDRLEEVDRAHGAARAMGHAVGDGEEDRGHVVAVDHAARNDALDALVPALAAHDDGATAV